VQPLWWGAWGEEEGLYVHRREQGTGAQGASGDLCRQGKPRRCRGDLRPKNYISHQPAGDEPLRGPEAIKHFAAGIREAFPDLEITIEEQIAEGDKVLTRFRTRGTHQGELWGIPPTGTEVELENMSMSRIEGGKMAEEWPAPDRLGMMQQLGVIEQPSG
jgi:predicted ester cyclase